MTRLWPIHHCVCRPVIRPPHWVPVARPPQRCFPSRRIKNLRCLPTLLSYALIAFLAILLVLLLGRSVEESHVSRAPSTADLYTKPEVCALLHVPENILNESVAQERQRSFSPSQQHSAIPFTTQTLPNVTVAHKKQDTLVAHCGDCGQCSTPRDVLIYDQTKNTLTDTTTKCAKAALIGGRRRAKRCMLETAGLSEGCTDCWVDNIMCDVKSCLFTCLWRQLTSWGESKSVGGALNACTKCDELRCGRQFLQCAGANRRRTGILSDIERDHHVEVCTDADETFWKSQEVHQWYQNGEAYEATKPEVRSLRG